MNIESNVIIEKIATLKHKPVKLVGYVMDVSEDDTRVRLYPELDPGFYHVFNKDCILIKLDGDGKQDKVSLLLDPECEVECIAKVTVNAELAASGRCTMPFAKRRNEVKDNFCDEITIIALIRAPYPTRILRLAQYFADKGTKLDCRAVSSAYIGCCRMFNQLIDLVLLPDDDPSKEGDINSQLDLIERTCRLD